MILLAIVKSELYAWLCLFKGVSTAFLRSGLEDPVLVEISVGCHEDVISDLYRGSLHFEGDSFPSEKGHWPRFERAINLLNRGKAFLDSELPKNQTLFVINLNASRASYYTLPVVFPWRVHWALAMVHMTVFSPLSYQVGEVLEGSCFFCPQVPVLFFSAQHLCGRWHRRRELVNKYTR